MEIPHTVTGNIDREEVLRRLPEVKDISDSDLRGEVINVVQNHFPDYFWTAPASSKHHPPEHRARHGLWLHTKRVCTVFERLEESMRNQGHMDRTDVDHGRAACLLHDMFKYGEPPTEVNGTTNDHDVSAAEYLDRLEDDEGNRRIPKEVVGAVEAHNGPWYRGSPPRTHTEQMVHIADMVASDENARVAVKEPHEVLVEQFPRIRPHDDE